MRKILALPFAFVLVLAAGCGDDDDTTAPTDGTTTTTTEATEPAEGTDAAPVSLPGTVNDEGTGDATSGTIEVELDDFYFGPTFIKATPGATVTLQLKNESPGGTPHTFTSPDLNVDETLQGGASTEVTVTLPESGATAFICRFHQGAGMQGAFFFNEGDALNG